MKKYILDLAVKEVAQVHERYVLLKLTDSQPLPEMRPGQFVEVRVDGSPSTFLRRPISINFVDRELNELWLLVATVGEGTRQLARLKAGERLNCLLPLGNGFMLGRPTRPSRPTPQPLPNREGSIYSCNEQSAESLSTPLPHREGLGGGSPLLVGGGVGVAPLLYLGKVLKENGVEPTFLLGARTKNDLLMLDEFQKYGRVFITTEDGSQGERGFVTNHTLLYKKRFTLIQTCGPTPMMKAVAHYAREQGIECEVSLENLMACGLGACLCCVEKTTKGNLCVCKEGPVFNIKQLLWD